MASQFDTVNSKLDYIIQQLDNYFGKLTTYGERTEKDELFGDTPFNPDDYDQDDEPIAVGGYTERPMDNIQGPPYTEDDGVIRPVMPGVSRRWVEYRLQDNTVDRYELDKLDPRIQQIIAASVEAGAWFQLYEGQDGQPRITAEEQILNQISMAAAPPTANQPDESQ